MHTHRQTLKRDYLAAKSRAGVFAIRNRITGRLLVDGSLNVEGALNRHRFELRTGAHRQPALREDWTAHGEAAFDFEVVDRVKPREAPDFDPARELQVLLTLWQQELGVAEAGRYGPTTGVQP